LIWLYNYFKLATLQPPHDGILRLKKAFQARKALWRNGSASDSRSEGCVFESRRSQAFSFVFEAQQKKRLKICVRSGIRTHAFRRRLRPERSALDRSAILTCLDYEDMFNNLTLKEKGVVTKFKLSLQFYMLA
jgi:hypothetical protein